jgi:hypothetical protein
MVVVDEVDEARVEAGAATIRGRATIAALLLSLTGLKLSIMPLSVSYVTFISNSSPMIRRHFAENAQLIMSSDVIGRKFKNFVPR